MQIDAATPHDDVLDSLSEIRKRHVDLMRRTPDAEATEKAAAEILDFMTRVAAAGAKLNAEDERARAQSVLDYWNAALLTSGAKTSTPDAPTELAPFVEDAASAAQAEGDNPFCEISALGLSDWARFFGREDSVAAVTELLRGHQIVCITGPAGSGRTSLALAGVAAQLERRSSEPYGVLTLPALGADPLRALLALEPISQNLAASDLRQPPRDLFRRRIEGVFGDRPALLVVDNVEELFTRCPDPEKRNAFAEALASFAAPGSANRALLIVLDDYAEQLFDLAALKPFALAEARHTPPPPTAAQIQRVLIDLAASARLHLGSDCAQEIAHDLQSDSSALALAQFMLLRLWPLSKGGYAGLDAYRQAGRPGEALAAAAERAYKSLSEEGKAAAKRVFLALESLDPRRDNVGRRASRRSLMEADAGPATEAALNAFLREGLLRNSAAPGEADDSIEIIHESLAFRWKQLAEWLEVRKRESERRLQLIATAQLWDKSKRSDAYLLNDEESIDAARPFAADDSPKSALLRAFLDASEKRVSAARRRKQRTMRFAVASLSVIVILLVTVVWLLFHLHNTQSALIQSRTDWIKSLSATEGYLLNKLSGSNINERRAGEITREKRTIDQSILSLFWWLDTLQKFGGSDIDLSNVTLAYLDLHDRVLNNLRLIGADIRSVNFGQPDGSSRNLTNAVFNNSSLTDAKFDNTDLSFSQFVQATLTNVVFSGANLYRTAFDRAKLYKVNFSNASLYLTSFSGATLDDPTISSLATTAWWLATGLTHGQVMKILNSPEFETNSAAFQKKQKEAAAQLLAEGGHGATKPSQYAAIQDIKLAYEHLVNANNSGHLYQRAIALGDWAWRLTTNGFGADPSVREDAPKEKFCEGVSDDPVPKSAQSAAMQAICLLKSIDPAKLTQEEMRNFGSNSETYLINFEDTLGYVLLQKKEFVAALDHLRTGASGKSPDALFRLAIAENANGQSEEAVKRLREAISCGYTPTHELFWLKEQLKAGEFQAELEKALGSSPAQLPVCPK